MQAVTITQITPPELENLIENTIRKILGNKKDESSQPEADPLLTIQQAADLLHLSVPTVYGLVSKAGIPCMKRGKRLYFSKAELTSWIKSGRKKTLAEFDADADAYLLNQNKRG